MQDTVFILEDNQEILDIYETVLENYEADLNVVTASNYRDAYEKLEQLEEQQTSPAGLAGIIDLKVPEAPGEHPVDDAGLQFYEEHLKYSDYAVTAAVTASMKQVTQTEHCIKKPLTTKEFSQTVEQLLTESKELIKLENQYQTALNGKTPEKISLDKLPDWKKVLQTLEHQAAKKPKKATPI